MTSGGCCSAAGVADAARQVLPKVKVYASGANSKKYPRGGLNTDGGLAFPMLGEYLGKEAACGCE